MVVLARRFSLIALLLSFAVVTPTYATQNEKFSSLVDHSSAGFKTCSKTVTGQGNLVPFTNARKNASETTDAVVPRELVAFTGENFSLAYRLGFYPYFNHLNTLDYVWEAPEERGIIEVEGALEAVNSQTRQTDLRKAILVNGLTVTLNPDPTNVLDACAAMPRYFYDIPPHRERLRQRVREIENNPSLTDEEIDRNTALIKGSYLTYKGERHEVRSTWITPDIKALYLEGAKRGEVFGLEIRNREGKLIGGQLSVTAGGILTGESVFHAEDGGQGAGILAVAALVKIAHDNGLEFIDVQGVKFIEENGKRVGVGISPMFKGYNIPRAQYEERLAKVIARQKTLQLPPAGLIDTRSLLTTTSLANSVAAWANDSTALQFLKSGALATLIEKAAQLQPRRHLAIASDKASEFFSNVAGTISQRLKGKKQGVLDRLRTLNWKAFAEKTVPTIPQPENEYQIEKHSNRMEVTAGQPEVTLHALNLEQIKVLYQALYVIAEHAETPREVLETLLTPEGVNTAFANYINPAP